jgi:uncharacterized membrane protein
MHKTLALSALLIAPSLEGCATQVAYFKREAAMARGAPERCFGVARAGHNDCRTQAHICAGWSRQDRDRTAFVYVPAGSCVRIVGGSLHEDS